MVAVSNDLLADVERDQIQADLDACRTARARVRRGIEELRAAGRLDDAYEATLTLQLEAYDRWVARYEEELARHTIAIERANGRAFGQVAEDARRLLALRTGDPRQ